MVTRIGTFATQQALIQRMLDVQKRVFEGQTQVGTEKKSQDYIGIARDSFRILNIENEKNRLNRFVANNSAAETNLKAMTQSMKSLDDSLRAFRSEVIGFTARDLRDKSPEDESAVKDIQERAFALLNDMEFFLNLKIDGKYLFAGGKTNAPPVQLPYDNVKDFQRDYNGIGTTYATTRAAQLADVSFNNVNVTGYTQTTYGATARPVTQVDVAPNTFQSALVTDSSFGSLTFNNVGTDGTMTSDIPGAFSNLEVGQTFTLTNSPSGNGGVYTIKSISGDGTTITLDQPVAAPAASDPAGSSVEMRLVPPNGSTIFMTGSASNNDAYTVRWPTNAELVAMGFNPAAGDVTQGNVMFLSGQVFNPTPETANFATRPYYRGDRIETEHRVSETRTIKFGVTGLDPAFEKAIRGLAALAQGDLINNQQRGTDALALINDAIEHSPLSSEGPGDMQDILNRLAINQKTIVDAKEDQHQFLAFLDIRQIELENVDPTEAAVKLNDDVNALNVSFATLAKIQQLSLVNYL